MNKQYLNENIMYLSYKACFHLLICQCVATSIIYINKSTYLIL